MRACVHACVCVCVCVYVCVCACVCLREKVCSIWLTNLKWQTDDWLSRAKNKEPTICFRMITVNTYIAMVFFIGIFLH